MASGSLSEAGLPQSLISSMDSDAGNQAGKAAPSESWVERPSPGAEDAFTQVPVLSSQGCRVDNSAHQNVTHRETQNGAFHTQLCSA